MNDNNRPQDATAEDAKKMLSLEQDMAEVEGMISGARRALVGGEILDLTPLGERITALCEGVRGVGVTVSDPEALQQRLAVMVSDLTQLEQIIRAGAEQNGLETPDDLDQPDQDKD